MKQLIISLLIVTLFTTVSCKKDWLDEKPNKSLVIPTTLQDCQLLLDNNGIMNNREPGMGEVGADNYYKQYATWLTGREQERNMYTWKPDIFGTDISAEWWYEYEKIYYANAVLETVEKIEMTPGNSDQWKRIRGSALFFRATGHYNLVKLFAKLYDVASAATDPGIPVKTSADINIKATRGNVKAVYDQIIADLVEAKPLLPVLPDFKTRPSQTSTEAYLSDVYLTMSNYDKALEFATAALGHQNTLLNYNTLTTTVNAPFTRFNAEVIFHSNMLSYGMLSATSSFADTILYQSYTANDLRKVLFFRDRGVGLGFTFKGSYNQNSVYFTGIATDELYLIRSECYARKNNLTEAMNDLNTLLRTRWKTGTFVDFTASTQTEALTKILTERRKELLFRGRRWNDLRRLNKEAGFAITLKRILNGETFTLPPNDLKYVYPIPPDEIKLSGLEQNPRQ